MVTLKQLRRYAADKGKQVMKIKPEIYLVDRIKNSHINPKTKQPDTVLRSYKYIFTPEDKRKKPYMKGYQIEISKRYYEKYKNRPKELKSAISHELAHVIVPIVHNARFRKVARRLGSDKTHLKANWD